MYSSQDYSSMQKAIDNLAAQIIEVLFQKKDELLDNDLSGLDIEIFQWMLSLDQSCKAVLKKAQIDIKHENKYESKRELDRDTKLK